MQRPLPALFVVSLVCLILGAILGRYSFPLTAHDVEAGHDSRPTPSDENRPRSTTSHAKHVEVLKPQRKDVARTLTVPGSISPWLQATIYAKVPGYLKWVGVDKGDFVTKDMVLAIIDAPEIEDQFREARASADIRDLTYRRLSAVYRDNPDLIARQDVDVAKAAADEARHLRENRRAILSYTKVTAPFDGLITARFADPGALIQAATASMPAATPMFTIMDLNVVRIYVTVPQELALLAKPGIQATIETRELPGRHLFARITRTAGVLEPTTRTLLVEIDVPNPRHELRPGMFMSVTLRLAFHANAIVVPPRAIVSPSASGEGGGHMEGKQTDGSREGRTQHAVFVVHDRTVHEVPVSLGIDDGPWTEIREGLHGDEDLVVAGKEHIKDGDFVEAVPAQLPKGKAASQKQS